MKKTKIVAGVRMVAVQVSPTHPSPDEILDGKPVKWIVDDTPGTAQAEEEEA